MRVEVDHVKCASAGVCVKECPAFFRFQEGSKKPVVLLEEIPPSLQRKCYEVVQMCPYGAIRIIV